VNVFTAFLAGIVSFVSPCVLPLIPAYLSFLTGSSVEELKAQSDAASRARTMLHALCFVAGFTVVFMAIGLSASALGSAFVDYKDWIARIGGAVVIVLGLNMVGLFRSANRSFVASFLVGIGFAAGWSPCIGPILSLIILKASQQQYGQASFFLFVYSMGLAVPLLITAAAITQALTALNKVKRYLGVIEVTAGAFLILAGIVIVTGSFGRVAGFFYQYVKVPSI
jgi:cytochrome c-type biogenesis protein